jgi:chaperone required for assembly of F1-ATPase
MREILEDLFVGQAIDPMEAARRGVRPQLRQRFYRSAGVGQSPEGFAVVLDDRPVRTPARRLLAAPNRPLAEAIAAEWEAQSDVVDPARMPLTRLANSIIDGVVDAPEPVAAEVANFLGSDLLFYRAAEPAGLVARQAQHWDPVIAWARSALGARFLLAEGVMFVRQPDEALAAARTAIPNDPWRLGATHAVTTLTGSALLALALAHRLLSVEQAWGAAHVDEDWNLDQWGQDDQALARRAARFQEMHAAATVFDLLGRTPDRQD